MMTPAQAMAAAEQLRIAGKPAEAEAQYRRIIAHTPDFHPAYHAQGLMALGAGNLQLAADLIARAIEINGGVFIYHRNIGELFRRLGQTERAIAAGRSATTLKPDDATAHYNLGLAYVDNEDFTQAKASCERALALRPGHGEAWNNLGAALDHLGDTTGSIVLKNVG